ncbi:MAG: flagellin, partial [Rhodothermus sp.]|nr:flagellin [Rhodothermus sp.]
MSLGDMTRINTNLQALQAYTYLQRTNTELGLRQLRLATGSRINRAEDDSAGYSIASKLKAKIRAQEQALANIGDAK